MEDKILLQEIVGYLPYGLQSVSFFNDEPVVGLVTPSGIAKYTDNSTGSKLLLRPLSDYTKEITVNGKTFIPIDELRRYHAGHCEYVNISTPYIEGRGTIQFVPVLTTKAPYEYGFATLAMMQKLYEWHFDLHGLIYRGLVLDINTLNNEAKSKAAPGKGSK